MKETKTIKQTRAVPYSYFLLLNILAEVEHHYSFTVMVRSNASPALLKPLYTLHITRRSPAVRPNYSRGNACTMEGYYRI